jgi:hypothetical protein
MSISSSGPPGIVRTYSVRSNQSSVATPLADANRPTGAMTPSSEQEYDDRAIGVARTSDVPISYTPLQSELVTNGASHSTVGARDSPVEQLQRSELPSRRQSVTPPVPRKTPSPVERIIIPEKPTARKDIPRSTPTSSRGPPLAALQEATNWIDMPNKSVQNGTKTRSQSTGQQDALVRTESGSSSVEGNRSRSGTNPTERATLQRVSSSSSRSPSVATSILHSAKGSESSIGRARGLSRRLSEEDRQREFDSLVRGEETVKYTLTPQSMRDLDVCGLLSPLLLW